MRVSRLRRAVGVASAVIVVALSLGATGAMASVPAFFSPSEAGMQWSGSFKVFKNGGSEKTCTFNTFSVLSVNSTSEFEAPNTIQMSCTGGTELWWWPIGKAVYENGYFLEWSDYANTFGWHRGPYGEWGGEKVKAPWTNGSGTTPSKITFNKTKIGFNKDGSTVTATGTITATQFEGGLLTLTH